MARRLVVLAKLCKIQLKEVGLQAKGAGETDKIWGRTANELLDDDRGGP